MGGNVTCSRKQNTYLEVKYRERLRITGLRGEGVGALFEQMHAMTRKICNDNSGDGRGQHYVVNKTFRV